ncbi:MAG: GTP cyclohydrolase I FolE [Anaerolineae bacterium]|nr:GTP cyclohydrolase I FolE [Anaerolineae bacterium]
MSALRNDHNAMSNGNGSSNGNGRKPKDDEKITPVTIPYLATGEMAGLDDIEEFDLPFLDNYEETEVLTGDPEQYQRIHDAVHELLDAFNVNWEDPNYTDTPKRVAKAYLEYWASGYGRQPEDEITVFPNTSGRDDLVLVKDMRYYSTCSHHLAPFHGYAAIAYIPGENLLGLSKLGRILRIYAQRFQLQERLGAQTADKLMELLKPKGVMVVLYDSEHMCMSSRGVQLHEANTTTIAARGVFHDDEKRRAEVLSLIRSGK